MRREKSSGPFLMILHLRVAPANSKLYREDTSETVCVSAVTRAQLVAPLPSTGTLKQVLDGAEGEECEEQQVWGCLPGQFQVERIDLVAQRLAESGVFDRH